MSYICIVSTTIYNVIYNAVIVISAIVSRRASLTQTFSTAWLVFVSPMDRVNNVLARFAMHEHVDFVNNHISSIDLLSYDRIY